MHAREMDYARMHAQKLLLLLATSACFCLIIWFVVTSPPSTSTELSSSLQHPQTYNTSAKKILMWNTFFSSKHFGHSVGSRLFEDYHCPVTNCHIWDMSDGVPVIPVEDFDLVWFHAWAGVKTRPASRKPHQVYLFYLHESPDTNRVDLSSFDGFFNWTATYRIDSDIYMPYGWFTRKPFVYDRLSRPSRKPVWMEPQFNLTSISTLTKALAKTDLVVWLVSNCVNILGNRDLYVDELSRHISVDVFGKCGAPCGENCADARLEKKYKFYLSFENSICVDYVTEKFFRIMSLDMVPIVYGGADYARLAPPHSYIDANAFATPRDLAEYLVFLDNNVAEYVKYFWWKDVYDVQQGTEHVLCEMCARLHVAERPVKVIGDLQGWWNAPEQCQSRPVGFGVWVKRALKGPVQFLELFTFSTVLVLLIACAGVSCVGVALMKRARVCWRTRRRTRVKNNQYAELNKVVYN